MNLTLEEQLAICDRYAERSCDELIEFIEEHKPEIVKGARLGFIAGYDTYGDATWNKTPAEIRQEKFMECRDGVAYGVIELFKSLAVPRHVGTSTLMRDCAGKAQDDTGAWVCRFDGTNDNPDCDKCRAEMDRWTDLAVDAKREEPDDNGWG